jgi:hypothetical protein
VDAADFDRSDDDTPPPAASDDALAHCRALAAARQRRRRACQTDDQRQVDRAKGRERKQAMRRSAEYLVLPPEDKWVKKGRKGLPLRQRPFVGVDGEGGNVVKHAPDCTARGLDNDANCGCPRTHHYTAITVGDHTLQTSDGQPLTSTQLIEFLANQPSGTARLVGYFFDYDVTFILRDLHPDKVRSILNPGPQRPLNEEASEP